MSYPADPYWSYVKTLLHFDGVHGSTKMVDERHNALSVFGTAQTSSYASKFGGTSCAFDGAGTYLTGSNSWHSIGVQDFCWETWSYLTDRVTAYPVIFANYGAWGSGTLGLYAGHQGSITTKYQVACNNIFPAIIASGSIAYNVWTHLALVRSGNTLTLYVNGVSEGSCSVTGVSLMTTGSFGIGAQAGSPADTYIKGYLDDFRVTVGVPRYTANFTPPTAAFPHSGVVDNYYDKVVLHMPFNGERGAVEYVDKKNHMVAFGGALPAPAISITQPVSPQFGRSVLSVATTAEQWLKTTSADYLVGGGDFCIEGRHAATGNTGNTNTIFALMAEDGVTVALGLNYYEGLGTLRLIVAGVTIFTAGTNGALSGNTCGHWAVVRNGTEIKVYAAGVQIGTTHVVGSAPLLLNGDLYLFGRPGAYTCYGVHEEIRFTKGQARYVNLFSPPTEPFPQVGIQFLSGTVLDENSNPISRKVRAFRRSDALLTDTTMSDPTTGAFEVRAADTSEHYVMVFDDAKNAMVYDHVVPVV